MKINSIFNLLTLIIKQRNQSVTSHSGRLGTAADSIFLMSRPDTRSSDWFFMNTNTSGFKPMAEDADGIRPFTTTSNDVNVKNTRKLYAKDQPDTAGPQFQNTEGHRQSENYQGGQPDQRQISEILKPSFGSDSQFKYLRQFNGTNISKQGMLGNRHSSSEVNLFEAMKAEKQWLLEQDMAVRDIRENEQVYKEVKNNVCLMGRRQEENIKRMDFVHHGSQFNFIGLNQRTPQPNSLYKMSPIAESMRMDPKYNLYMAATANQKGNFADIFQQIEASEAKFYEEEGKQFKTMVGSSQLENISREQNAQEVQEIMQNSNLEQSIYHPQISANDYFYRKNTNLVAQVPQMYQMDSPKKQNLFNFKIPDVLQFNQTDIQIVVASNGLEENKNQNFNQNLEYQMKKEQIEKIRKLKGNIIDHSKPSDQHRGYSPIGNSEESQRDRLQLSLSVVNKNRSQMVNGFMPSEQSARNTGGYSPFSDILTQNDFDKIKKESISELVTIQQQLATNNVKINMTTLQKSLVIPGTHNSSKKIQFPEMHNNYLSNPFDFNKTSQKNQKRPGQ